MSTSFCMLSSEFLPPWQRRFVTDTGCSVARTHLPDAAATPSHFRRTSAEGAPVACTHPASGTTCMDRMAERVREENFRKLPNDDERSRMITRRLERARRRATGVSPPRARAPGRRSATWRRIFSSHRARRCARIDHWNYLGSASEKHHAFGGAGEAPRE